MKKLVVLVALALFALPAAAAPPRLLAPMDWWPVWSPDGTHIAFTRVYQRHMDLYSVDLRTHRVTYLASGAGQLNPTWSHDGTRLAYSSGGVLRVESPDGTRKSVLDAPGRAYAPAWRPTGNDLAYLTTYGATNLDLWEGDQFWARNAIGSPAWSPDGTRLAFQRDDGIYVTTGPGAERRVVAVDNPGPPAWSYEGSTIAFSAHGSVYAVAASGGAASLKVRHLSAGIRTPSWSKDDARLSTDRAWSPVALRSVRPGPRPSCPGHTVLLEGASTLTGSCTVQGTARADVIEGTPLWGDVILAGAGNDQVHANDRHTDRVSCGPGRDTVWADRADKLTGCEIVHR